MYNFKEVEGSVQKLWKKHEKEIRATTQYDEKKRLFSFLEGPPTANAPPGLHHVEARVFKDLFCRFKHMQGYTVPRKAGWDCHGLPVEVQIEKALKLNSKKDILRYGVEKFTTDCRKSVFSYIREWDKLTDKMAFLIDLEKPYVTLDNDYIESVWWSLKQIYDKKLLYEGHKVVPFCPRCETPLSSHEVALGYEDTTELTVTVKFKLKNKNRYFLVWTTTPWTLPSNLALAVNPEIDYAVVRDKTGEYILAESLITKYFGDAEIIEKIKGSKLKGLEYEPIFPYFQNLKAFKVITGDFVTTDEGTGIVHMAPAFGEVDYDACKAEKLPFVQPVNSEGKFTREAKDFEGLFVKDADDKIIRMLEDKKIIFRKQDYTHSYPFCWRCSTPLIYFAMKSWFIGVSRIRDRLIANNKLINWYPKHIKEGRFGEWLANAKDWALSRSKFWGTPLPIWRCSCGEEKIIGSIEELKKNAVKIPTKIDLHRPYIDDVKLKCKCGKEMQRIPDVIDCWYDSGAATFAQFHYPFENQDLFKKRFPYDFIAEGLDQTRGWFYTLHVLSTILFDDVAYRSVVCAGLLVDEKGEKMSKSRGNILNPWDMFQQVGVDAVRLQMCATDPGEPKRFGVNLVKENVFPLLTILWNCCLFTKGLRKNVKAGKLEIEDKWILSRLNSLVKNLTAEFEKHNYHYCLSMLKDFVNKDLSRFYIKLIRERASENDEAVSFTLYSIFDKLTRLLAPFAPYISESIYQELVKRDKSVHFDSWPSAEEKLIDKELEESMEIVQGIIEKALAARAKIAIGVRWPLASLIVYTKKENFDAAKKLEGIVKSQLNVKAVILKESTEEKVELDAKLTPELESEGYAREIARHVQDARKKAGLVKTQKIDLVLQADNELAKMLENFEKFLKERVNASKLSFGAVKVLKHKIEVEVRGRKITIGFEVK